MMDAVTSSIQLMTNFADATGLSPGREVPERYLWTDAFGVCNYLGLYEETHSREFLDLALRLVDQVHSTLGRFRRDDPRTGWISGLDEKEALLHPTAGGLRIGKKLKERGPTEPLNERLEWDRDGQYYHYLTKWMHALDRTAQVTGELRFNRWARDLAHAAHRRFIYGPPSGGGRRMYWKMSTDLSYPLVGSMGLHDPLDGLVTYSQLAETARQMEGKPVLKEEIADMAAMCVGRDWATDDPLGIGSLLSDALRVARLMTLGRFRESSLLSDLLDASFRGLASFDLNSLEFPPNRRLAFRELGLSIGLRAFQRLQILLEDRRISFGPRFFDATVRRLGTYERLADHVEDFWVRREHQEGQLWAEHRHINMVMLATSLLPTGFLGSQSS
jgi:hypothetical protein